MTIMREEDLEIAIKVVIVGNGAVGKSSMIQRYCKGIFTKDYKKTIGVDFLERQITVSGEEVRLMLWDTAGQEEFDAITKAYYRGAQACVIAFSTTDRGSFLAIRKWKKKILPDCWEAVLGLISKGMSPKKSPDVTLHEVESEIAQLAAGFCPCGCEREFCAFEAFTFIVESIPLLLSQALAVYSSSGILLQNPTSQHVLGSSDLAALSDKATKEHKAVVSPSSRI
ncbi:unnamed protein product, partial [Meganyctiphanes norvegica]